MNWKEMQKIAYGFLKLQPDQFWVLTLREFNLMIDGYQVNERKEMRKLAQLASWVTAPHLKRPVSPDKLIGGDIPVDKEQKRTTPEETAQVLGDLESEFGKQ